VRVLVTGSAGFIGRHVVRDLSDRGFEVTALDRVVETDPIAGVAYMTVDLLKRESLMSAVTGSRAHAVVHLAARTDLEGRTLADYSANIEGVSNLVEAIRATPTIRRAIYTSSQLVCRVGYVPSGDEDYSPDTLYGESKVRSETIVRASNGGDVEWCLVRPTTVWGPGMGPHYQRFFRMIAAGRYVHIGRGPLYKSYGYVGNIAHLYRMLLTVPAATIVGRTIYLADYEPLSLRDWADEFQRQLGAPPIRRVPAPLARAVAALGDAVNRLGWRRFPYNSFRLRNVLTEYVFDLVPTADICGPLPFSTQDGIIATVSWLEKTGIVPPTTANRSTEAHSAPSRQVPAAPPAPNDIRR
jgi:nucleoside-diphosphate-sugar epimerase